MIVDDIKITLEAGKGGNGLAAFSRVKFAKGPTGGNGGNGGNIFFEGVADLGALRQFRFKKDHKADKKKRIVLFGYPYCLCLGLLFL